MPTSNFFVYIWIVLIQLIKDLALLPVWWYTLGFYKVLRWCGRFIFDWWRSLALSVWLRYLFVPMYGQSDFTGRLISFFMRAVQILFRSVVMLFWLTIALLIIVAYLALPLLIALQIYLQIIGIYGA